MVATDVQVFGPTTVDPGFTTTGEKTLLAMDTTLPGGGKNVILCVYMPNGPLNITAEGTLRIYKGATLLYETAFSQYLSHQYATHPILVMAVDSNPVGNDSYTFRVNITTAGSATGTVHVQAMVIKADDAVWGYNTTGVSFSNAPPYPNSVTITSVSTSFPAGSKVAVVGVLYGYRISTSTYPSQISTLWIKRAATQDLLRANNYDVFFWGPLQPFWYTLTGLDITAADTQTYSLEVSSTYTPLDPNPTYVVFGEIVAFTVRDGVFLESDYVFLTSGSQATVGELFTSFSGDVAVIATVDAGNDGLVDATIFGADDVTLQLNNSTTGQITNQTAWFLGSFDSAKGSYSGSLPMFRYDTAVINPSYQVNVTARADDSCIATMLVFPTKIYTKATDVQVFGPTTVDPGFTTTGEKTLLAMDTTLPGGGKNVILCVYMPSSVDVAAQGRFRIYKGTTLLYETQITEYLNASGMRAKPHLVMAVDDSPAGNDSYTFRMVVTTAATSTYVAHVQGIVIKVNDVVWGYNTTGVSIANGATATVASVSTSFPAGSKVAVVGVLYGSKSGQGHVLIGPGNCRLKSDTTILASNQFAVGSYQSTEPAWVSIIYLDSPASASQTYSLEIYNDSGADFTFYGEIVAFTVRDGVFLDTASVALTIDTQVTVGDLATSLSGNVAVIAIAAAENTSTSDVVAFSDGGALGDVILQLNNTPKGRASNQVNWYLERTGLPGRSGALPVFRFDIGVSSPSYQVKMTAREAGINGEAKILAFKMDTIGPKRRRIGRRSLLNVG